MDKISKVAVVRAVAISCIEFRQPEPADRTPADLIERKGVEEGGMAARAGVLGNEGFNRSKAVLTDGKARKVR